MLCCLFMLVFILLWPLVLCMHGKPLYFTRRSFFFWMPSLEVTLQNLIKFCHVVSIMGGIMIKIYDHNLSVNRAVWQHFKPQMVLYILLKTDDLWLTKIWDQVPVCHPVCANLLFTLRSPTTTQPSSAICLEVSRVLKQSSKTLGPHVLRGIPHLGGFTTHKHDCLCNETSHRQTENHCKPRRVFPNFCELRPTNGWVLFTVSDPCQWPTW